MSHNVRDMRCIDICSLVHSCLISRLRVFPLGNNARRDLNMARNVPRVINNNIQSVICIRQHRLMDKATTEDKEFVHPAKVKFYS